MKIRMYTQSNAYLRKLSSTTLLVLLLASALLAFLPIAAVHGSTGHPDIGVVTTQGTLSGFAAAKQYVNVTAGPSTVAGTDCKAFPTACGTVGYLAINFSSGGMLFSGSQFALYLSKDGYSEISKGDIPIAGGLTDNVQFKVSTLFAAGVTTIKEQNGTFYLGYGYLSGPIPTKISNSYTYIKIYDGATTSVAVSKEYISIMPGISVTPTTGVAGTSVVISGGGFPSNSLVDINYSFSLWPWNSAMVTMKGQWVTGIPTGSGYFTKSTTILDTKQAINPLSYEGIIPTVTIMLNASTHTYKRTFYTTASATFTENTRVFNQEYSYRPDGSIGASATKANGPYGNDTGTTSTEPVLNDLKPLNAYVTGSIGLEGNYSAIGSPVTIWIGSTQVATATPNGISGQWVANFTVPVLAEGPNLVKVINNGVTYEFDIYIVPTLVITPSSGPIGTTVKVTAYGFAPTGIKNPVVLYWYEETWNDGFNYWLANTTVGLNGAFNSTSPVQFLVPTSYGGGHTVTATFASDVCATKTPCKAGGTTGAISILITLGTAVFTVTPTFEICVTSTTCGSGSTHANTVSVNANTRTILNATGTGFGFSCYGDEFCEWYQVNIDNAMYSDYNTAASYSGTLYINFSAAGFQPGLHQVELYIGDVCGPYSSNPTNPCVGAPVAIAYFNVTTIGAYTGTGTGGLPTSTINEITNINNNVNTILSTITTMNSNVNLINTNVKTILGWQSTILSINSTVNGLKTTLGTMQTTLGTITTDLGTITTNLGTVLTAAQNAATQATTAANSAKDAKNSVSDTETYVLVVAVLVAITLVLELAVLVRKLS